MAVAADESIDPQTDATWILSSTFIVFTMQSGFGLLESGSVSVKNELNIMVKNAVDVVFGGLTYWMVGYGLSFGDSAYSNPVTGWGYFFVNANDDKLGIVYSKFFFQSSFATTATTIVSGAMAERTKLTSYMLFSMFNTLLFCIPAHWVWASNGWLYRLGVVDIAGAGPVHIVGGVTGLVATLLLKPRHGRYNGKFGRIPQMSSPTNAVLGMFMLWWGWLGFNCGSTFGISGMKWKLAARSAASTLCSSISGGVAGFALSYIVKKRTFDVTYMINGLLGSLVSITAVCAIVQPWEGLVIGFIGSIIANAGVALLDKLRIDDPVGCVGTHALSGFWGMLVAGLFIREDSLLEALYLQNATAGIFHDGGFRQLGVQALALVSITVWTLVMSYIILKIIDLTIGLRVPLAEEIIGADIVEHGIGDLVYDKKTGRVMYPPDNNGCNGHVKEQQRGTRVRSGSLRTSLTGINSLLGHTGRRRTLAEINTDLSAHENNSPTSFGFNIPIDEENAASRQHSNNFNGTCFGSSPRESDSSSRRRSSCFTQIRRKFQSRSLKHFQRGLDPSKKRHSVDVERPNGNVYDNRQKTSSLRLPRSKHNCVLSDRLAANEPETSDCESYFSGYESLTGSYPSSSTISCHISYNDLKQFTDLCDNNTSSHAITHF